MSEVVCTVTPTIQDGTVVRWYRSETAAAHGRRWAMATATRNGFEVHQDLTDGDLLPGITARAALVHKLLRRKPDADLSGWATHRRQQAFGGELVPVGAEGGSGGNR